MVEYEMLEEHEYERASELYALKKRQEAAAALLLRLSEIANAVADKAIAEKFEKPKKTVPPAKKCPCCEAVTLIYRLSSCVEECERCGYAISDLEKLVDPYKAAKRYSRDKGKTSIWFKDDSIGRALAVHQCIPDPNAPAKVWWA